MADDTYLTDEQIAAFDPPAVLALLDALVTARTERDEARAQIQAVRGITADIARVEHPHGIPADADCMCCLIHRALDGEAQQT